MVQVVNALGPIDLIDTFALKSGRKADFSNIFQIGDTLVVAAESQLASTYELEIYEDSSVVFVEQGEFSRAKMEAEVLLSPPVFSGGHTYDASFRVYAYDKLIPGSYFTDSIASVFEVVGVATRLGLETEYDAMIGGLYLNATLTDLDGYPVANETVDFKLQYANTGRLTEGWGPWV